MHAHHARTARAILGEKVDRKTRAKILPTTPTLDGPDDRPRQPLTAANWITVPPKPQVTARRSAKIQGWERTIAAHDPHNLGRTYTASAPSYDGGKTTREFMLHPDQAVGGLNHREQNKTGTVIRTAAKVSRTAATRAAARATR